MKKLSILIVAFLFTAGMAFAQNNDATIDQLGDDLDASINQIGELNKAFVDQTDGSDRNPASSAYANADIEQIGDENYVNLVQSAYFLDDSFAEIQQIGNRNIVEGTSAESAWLQSNGGGLLDVAMVGDDNRLYSLRSEAQKNSNELILDILGNDNLVGAAQESGKGTVLIEGDLNNVTLSQIGNNAAFNTAYVDIFGTDNGVSVTQTLSSNSATVNVIGDSNSSTINQN